MVQGKRRVNTGKGAVFFDENICPRFSYPLLGPSLNVSEIGPQTSLFSDFRDENFDQAVLTTPTSRFQRTTFRTWRIYCRAAPVFYANFGEVDRSEITPPNNVVRVYWGMSVSVCVGCQAVHRFETPAAFTPYTSECCTRYPVAIVRTTMVIMNINCHQSS